MVSIVKQHLCRLVSIRHALTAPTFNAVEAMLKFTVLLILRQKPHCCKSLANQATAIHSAVLASGKHHVVMCSIKFADKHLLACIISTSIQLYFIIKIVCIYLSARLSSCEHGLVPIFTSAC